MKNTHNEINNWELNQLRIKELDVKEILHQFSNEINQELNEKNFILNEMKKSKLYKV